MLDFVMMNNSAYMAIATLSVMSGVFVQLNWNALMVVNMYNMAVLQNKAIFYLFVEISEKKLHD